jgi:hypothetical protein
MCRAAYERDTKQLIADTRGIPAVQIVGRLRHPLTLNPNFQEFTMNKTLPACLLSLATFASVGASAAEPLVRFEDGIGVQPLRAGAVPNTVQANTVQGVSPPGAPWVISRLSADVSTDGRIKVDGRGLVLAGTNSIGTPAGQSVFARLVCAGVPHDSELVPLDARGDFRIEGFVNPIPPSSCATPVLLVINAGGTWFAAGIPKQ